MDETELIAAFARGDPDAQRQLIAHLYRWVAVHLHRFGVPVNEHDELAQDILLLVVERQVITPAYSLPQIRRWVQGTTHHRYQRWRRAVARHRGAVPDESVERWPTLDPPAEAALERLEGLARLHDCIGRLPEPLRVVLQARVQHDEPTYRDIAQSLGVHEDTVRARACHARRHLRTCLGAEWP